MPLSHGFSTAPTGATALLLAIGLATGAPVLTPKAAQAQLLSVSGFGWAGIGSEIKNAAPGVDGVAPRTIVLAAINSGEIPWNPDVPDERVTYLEASAIGIGYTNFGVMGGRIDAEAKAEADFFSPYGAAATGNIDLSFIDSATVISSTLSLGTPVTVIFPVSLGSAVIATGPRPPGSSINYALTDVDFEVFDLNTFASSRGSFSNNTVFPGTPNLSSGNLMLSTAVGNRLRLYGRMTVRANATASLPGPGGGNAFSASSVIANHTAHLYYTPTPDVTLLSDSGHDYDIALASAAAPEPATLALLVTGVLPVLGALIRRRKKA